MNSAANEKIDKERGIVCSHVTRTSFQTINLLVENVEPE
jgi:hypothetical protein